MSLPYGNHIGGTATCKDKAVCEICHQQYGDFGSHELSPHDYIEPSHFTTGNIQYWTCDNCGKYFEDSAGSIEITQRDTVLAVIPHSYSNIWYKDSTNHWKECECGNKDKIGSHEYSNSCDTTCNVCGYLRTTKHNYSVTVVPPTCIEKGYTLHKCTVCGNEYRDNFVDAKGHTFGEWEVVKKSDIGVEGLKEQRCTECHILLNSEVIPALKTNILLGDINCDGKVNSKDYALLKRYCLGTYEIEDSAKPAGDINKDGKVNSKDYALLKRACLGTYTIEQ